MWIDSQNFDCMVFSALSFAQCEILWYFQHVGIASSKSKATRVAPIDIDAGDPTIGFLLDGMAKLCCLVRKYMAAQRFQLASVYKGEAEKILLVKKAEAEADAKYLSGVGVAKQRQAITDGLRENILSFSHTVSGTSAKEMMDLIMVTQYFDNLKELGNSSKNTTVFIPQMLF